MGETEYSEALKLGKEEYRARIAKGRVILKGKKVKR